MKYVTVAELCFKKMATYANSVSKKELKSKMLKFSKELVESSKDFIKKESGNITIITPGKLRTGTEKQNWCFYLFSSVKLEKVDRMPTPPPLEEVLAPLGLLLEKATFNNQGLKLSTLEARFQDAETMYEASLSVIEGHKWALFPSYIRRETYQIRI